MDLKNNILIIKKMHLITFFGLFLLLWSWFIIICLPVSICLAYIIVVVLSSLAIIYLAIYVASQDILLRKDYFKIKVMYRLFTKYNDLVFVVSNVFIIFSTFICIIVLSINLNYYIGTHQKYFPYLNTHTFSNTMFIFSTIVAPFYSIIFTIFVSIIYFIYNFYISFFIEH